MIRWPDRISSTRIDDLHFTYCHRAQDRVRKRAAGKQASIPKAPVRPKQLSGKKRRRDPPSPAEQDPRDDADIPNAASATSTGSDDSGISSHASSEDDKQAQREKGLQKVEEEMQELGRRMEADKLKWERSHKKQDAKMRKLAAKRARLMK